MRDVIKYFIPAFFLFAGIGFLSGWEERERTAQEALYQALELKERSGRYYLSLQCKELWAYHYSVDLDEGRRDADLRHLVDLHPTALGAPSERHMKYFGLLSGFLGGTTGGYTIQDFLKRPSAGRSIWTWNHLKKTVLGFIGAVTGYSFGHWLGSTYDTGCDSEVAKALLEDPEKWREFERKRLILTVKELEYLEGAKIHSASGRNIYPWENDPSFECVPKLSGAAMQLKEFLSRSAINPGSEQFESIISIKNTYDQVAKSPEYQTLLSLRLARETAKRGEAGARLAEHAGYSDERWRRTCEALGRKLESN